MTQSQATPRPLHDPPPRIYEHCFVEAIGAPLAHDLVAAAHLQPGERVLDVACGTGVVARLAAERVGARGAVTGVDLNPGMLAVARTMGSAIEWHEADAAATGLPDHSYDVVLCQLGLQLFADQPGAVREMRRVLAPGGRVAINVPGPTPAMFDILLRGLADHISAEAAAFMAKVFSLADPAALRDLLERAGLERVRVESAPARLTLPPPADFLWGYLGGTPLAPALAEVDERRRAVLEADIVRAWQRFTRDDGTMLVELDVLTARAGSGSGP